MTGVCFFNSEDYLDLEADRIGGDAVRLTLSDGSRVKLISRPIAGTDASDGVSVYGYPDIDAQSPHRRQIDLRGRIDELADQTSRAGMIAAFFRLGLDQDVGGAWTTDRAACVQVGESVVVDLARDWDEIMMSFRPRLRSQLRSDPDLDIDYCDDVAAFHRIYIENMQRVGANPTYLFTEAYLRRLCEIEGAGLVIARDRDGPVSGAISVVHGADIYYHLGATGDRGLAISPLRQVLAWLCRRHAGGPHRDLVLGGGLGGASDELLRFKRGFSKRTVPVFGLKLVADAAAFSRLSGCEPRQAFDQSFFPPYRRNRG